MHPKDTRGENKQKLAELAGLHPRVLQKMESAGSNILSTTLVRIQQALDCPWGQLMPSPGAAETIEEWLARMNT